MSLQSTYQSRKELLVENLETMGVTDYSADDGLTTLINAVLEIAPVPPTPTPSSISLTGSKSILSYADGSDESVLTATVLDANDDPVEGVSVDLYKDSVLWDTISTGSSGTVSKTYSSAGVGDVSFTAEVGSLVSETYSISDLLLYADGTSNAHFSSATSSDGWFTVASNNAIISIDSPIDLPSSFEITYIGNTSQSQYGWNLIMMGAEASCNQYNAGMNTTGGFVRKGREGCTMTNLINQTDIYSYGTDVTVVYKYDNGVHKLKINNSEYTVTNTDYSMSKFFGIGLGAKSKIKELKIKPL